MNDSYLKLGQFETKLMALYKRFGSKGIVAVITAVAITLSVSITMLANLHQHGHLNLHDKVAYLKAVFIPLIVASIASTMLTRLLVQLEHAYQIMTVLSTTDPLTGSANRRGFLDNAAQRIHTFQQSDECLVGMVDLDKFKSINDTYGHDAGDKALQKVAKCLECEIGSHGMVGRLGGDEFAFVVFISDFELKQQQTRIQENCSHLILENGIVVKTSIGMVTLRHTESINSALARADQDLYDNKSSEPPEEASSVAA